MCHSELLIPADSDGGRTPRKRERNLEQMKSGVAEATRPLSAARWVRCWRYRTGALLALSFQLLLLPEYCVVQSLEDRRVGRDGSGALHFRLATGGVHCAKVCCVP
jgi:hypothetical protein